MPKKGTLFFGGGELPKNFEIVLTKCLSFFLEKNAGTRVLETNNYKIPSENRPFGPLNGTDCLATKPPVFRCLGYKVWCSGDGALLPAPESTETFWESRRIFLGELFFPWKSKGGFPNSRLWKDGFLRVSCKDGYSRFKDLNTLRTHNACHTSERIHYLQQIYFFNSFHWPIDH